jgi:acetyltransferase-like isoleucine patch superfamily enzyme
VGHDSGIYHGTFFDLGPDGEVEIGNYCTLVGAIISTNSLVIIGDYTFLAHEVVLADSFAATPFELHSRPERQDKEDSPAGNPYFSYGNSGFPSSAKKIIIGENCWIGARAVLLSGASVGEGAIVGAAAVVDFEIPPYAVVAGNPARIVGKVEGRRK